MESLILKTFWLWFKSYYNFMNAMCEQFSGLLLIISRVLQGSILGPLLFTLYINNLPNSLLVARPSLFADVTKCTHIIKDQTDHITLQMTLRTLPTTVNLDNENLVSKCTHLKYHFSLLPN